MIGFGFQPPGAGPLATAERLKRLAIRAEALGYDALSVTDHVVLPINMKSAYPYNSTAKVEIKIDESDWFDPITLLGLWSGITSRIKLQTSVLVLPYRNPIVTAKMLASLDVISNGRLEIGIGTGWMKEEFDILHAQSFERRGKVTDEYLKIFRTLWSDRRPSFKGEFYSVDDVVMYPKPVDQGRIPILVGGTSKAAIRRAAHLGDGWQPLKITAEDLSAGIAAIGREAEASGRALPPDFQVSVRFGLRVSPTPTERRRLEDPDRVFVGTPDEVTALLRPYIDGGATRFMFDARTCSADELDETMELFAEQVMPRFSER